MTGYALGVVFGAPLMTVLGFGGVFAVITYIAPMATHVTGLPTAPSPGCSSSSGSAWSMATSAAAGTPTAP